MGRVKQKQTGVKKDGRSLRQWLLRYKKTLTIIVVILLVIEISVTQYTRYIYYTIYCGHRPISATKGSNFAGGAGGRYYIPGLPGYDLKGYNKVYFCSTADAAQAGYKLGTIGRDFLPYVDEFYDSAPNYYQPIEDK